MQPVQGNKANPGFFPISSSLPRGKLGIWENVITCGRYQKIYICLELYHHGKCRAYFLRLHRAMIFSITLQSPGGQLHFSAAVLSYETKSIIGHSRMLLWVHFGSVQLNKAVVTSKVNRVLGRMLRIHRLRFPFFPSSNLVCCRNIASDKMRKQLGTRIAFEAGENPSLMCFIIL